MRLLNVKRPGDAIADFCRAQLINKDFYHAAAGRAHQLAIIAHPADRFTAALEVKLKAPNGVNFTAKGTSSHDGAFPLSVTTPYPNLGRTALTTVTARGQEGAFQRYCSFSLQSTVSRCTPALQRVTYVYISLRESWQLLQRIRLHHAPTDSRSHRHQHHPVVEHGQPVEHEG